jgi:predicted flap endonuclease-1-like 5' DNA nuclease
MIQETNDDEAEVEADALIDLVDGPPPRGARMPPPPPVSQKAATADAKIGSASSAAAPPTSVVPPPPLSTADVNRPPSAPPVSRLSTLPLAPPRPGVPSSNPITSDRPSAPPRASTLPRAPSIPSPLPSAPPAPVERSPLAELQEQLDFARRAISVKEAEVRAVLAQRDKALLELESLRQKIATRELDVKELEFASLTRDTRIRELEKELVAARSTAGDSGDDLKLIRGIGPAFERELKRLGVRKFSQIAAWTADDIQSIAKKIKAKPDRIRRDNWISRAAELAAEREPQG